MGWLVAKLSLSVYGMVNIFRANYCWVVFLTGLSYGIWLSILALKLVLQISMPYISISFLFCFVMLVLYKVYGKQVPGWFPILLANYLSHVCRSLMEKKLRTGTTLIVDRYSYSGIAFSSAKGLDFEWCKAPEIGLVAPDLVFYLDIPPEKAAERGGYGNERYEKLEFQRKVGKSYQALRDASWQIVDALLPMDEIAKQMQETAINCVLECQKGKRLSHLWSCWFCLATLKTSSTTGWLF